MHDSGTIEVTVTCSRNKQTHPLRVQEAIVTNYERTRAEKVFGFVERNVHNFFYHHPGLSRGVHGWLLRQLSRPLSWYRHKIWNRYAYNKDGRMTNTTALRTLAVTVLVILAIAVIVLGLI